jgi:hypothetical protein
MNFIGRIESSHIGVELKYCERCGGLFLRPQQTEVIHCAGCTIRLVAQHGFEKPSPSTLNKKRNPRMVKGPKLRGQQIQGATKIEGLQGVAVAEVIVC